MKSTYYPNDPEIETLFKKCCEIETNRAQLEIDIETDSVYALSDFILSVTQYINDELKCSGIRKSKVKELRSAFLYMSDTLNDICKMLGFEVTHARDVVYRSDEGDEE